LLGFIFQLLSCLLQYQFKEKAME